MSYCFPRSSSSCFPISERNEDTNLKLYQNLINPRMISTKRRKDERLKLGLIIYIVELRTSKYSKYGASHQQSTVRSSFENRLSSFIHGLKDINSYHEHPTHVASFEFISCRNMTFRSTIKSSVSTFAVHPQSQTQQESGTNPFVFTTQWN